MSLTLDAQEQRWLAGADGAAMQLAMRLVVTAAEVVGADELVPIENLSNIDHVRDQDPEYQMPRRGQIIFEDPRNQVV